MEPSPRHKSISLMRARQDVRQLLQNIKLLQEKEVYLEKGINSLSEKQWNLIQCEINTLKGDMTERFAKYDNSCMKDDLKNRVLKRRKKRLQIRRRKTRKQFERRDMIERRHQLHMAIDRNLAREKQKDVDAQQALNAAEYAKWVLSNVTKKKADAQQYILLLNSLKDLRKARRIAAQTSSTDDSDNFDAKINALLAVWADALEEYENEEINIKSILTDNHKSTEEQWRDVLFGIDSKASGLNSEESNLLKFIEIRRGWDSCLVPCNFMYGSTVPCGWVLPPENPLNSWKRYRR